MENAVKIARHATGRQAVVVFDHAYHGRTNLTMAMTAKAMPYKYGFGPFAPEIYRVPMSYPLRDGGLSGAEAAARAIDMIEKQVGGGNVAAVLIEPIQGEGGFVVPAPGFLPALAGWARRAGAAFVADEIQTGFCRTGDWFASEHEGIEPDLVTTAKGMARRAAARRRDRPGRADGRGARRWAGRHLRRQPGRAARPRWRRSRRCASWTWPAPPAAIEARMRPFLAGLAAADPGIAEVRGRGAMLAIELVRPGTIEPDPAGPRPSRTPATRPACWC